MPKSSKKINYKARMKILRRFVDFNYDLRKPLTRGQKSAITKAYREIIKYRTKKFVPIKRQKGQTKKEFLAQKRALKKAVGQTGANINMIKGVFLDVPDNTKVKFKGNIILFETKGFTEAIIPSNGFFLAKNPKLYAKELWNKLDFDEIFIDYSGFGRSIGFQKTGSNRDEPILERFQEELAGMASKYRQVLQHAVSGFILRKNK